MGCILSLQKKKKSCCVKYTRSELKEDDMGKKNRIDSE